MKIVKNQCFGGYSLSPKALKRLAELNGKECYFFTHSYDYGYKEITEEEATGNWSYVAAFSVNNPNAILRGLKAATPDQIANNKKYNEKYEEISIDDCDNDRSNPNLVKVVEELGGGHRTGASGVAADLVIVEIPEGVEWEIDEYDGAETIREKHRSW